MSVTRRLFALMILCLTVNAYAEKHICPTNSEKQQKPEQCNVYLYPGLRIYEKSDFSSVPRIFNRIEVDVLKEDRLENNDWIDLSWYPNKSRSWVKKNDLIFYKSFKRVIGCFPLRSIVVEPGGDSQGSVWRFASNGEIKSLGNGMRSARAYYAKNLYVLRWVPVGGRDENLFYVDYQNKKVILEEADAGAEDKVAFEWRKEEEMKSCKTIPVTE